MKRLMVPCLTAVLATHAFAGDPPVDVTGYFPLGVFNQWRIVQEDDTTDTTFIKVTKVVLVDGVLRYTVVTPFFDTLEKVKLVMGVDDGEWNLYRIGVSNDDLEDLDSELITLDPPVLLGTTSEVLGTQHSTDVDAEFSVKLKFGPLSKTIDIGVTGTIDSRFDESVVGVDAPAASFDASDLLEWHLDFDLHFESLDDDIDFDGDATVEGLMLVADGLGYVLGTDPNSANHVLDSAILPGTTIGGDFTDPGTVLTGVGFGTPDLFTLDGAASDTTDGGDFVLSGVQLTHLLGGKLLLEGVLSPNGIVGTGVPFEMEGSCKISPKTGLGKVVLKGKTKQLTEKPLMLSVKQFVDVDTTALTITYKSGKDILGEMSLPVMPFPAERVELAFNTLVDKSFKAFKAKRGLGAEGVLSMVPPASFADGVEPKTFGVTLNEARKLKEGQADKHGYVLTQTGLTSKLMTGSAVSTSAEEFLLAKFGAKINGLKIKPADINDVETTVADVTLD